jgi:hypothetical protein
MRRAATAMLSGRSFWGLVPVFMDFYGTAGIGD